ncbi:hypothetical protein JCM25156A_24550 [Komagataeibacter kakiaceti JCM 25156]
MANRLSGSIFSSDFEIYLPSFTPNCYQGYRMSLSQRGALYRSIYMTVATQTEFVNGN